MGRDCGCSKFIIATYQTDPGTGGGQATDGSGGNWSAYPLNTLRVNDYSLASLVGNDIFLPAGTYRILDGGATFQHWSRNNMRVVRLDTGAMITDAVPGYNSNIDTAQYPRLTPAEFTLQNSAQIELQYLLAFVNSSPGSDTNDLGVSETDVTDGPFNTFGFIQIEKIST